MDELISKLPASIRATVRRLLEHQVTDGGSRFVATGDYTGRSGQREISQLMVRSGVDRDSELYTAVNLLGRDLYYGRVWEAPPTPAGSTATAPSAVLTSGQWKSANFMMSDGFSELVELHRTALGDTATIYFRPTDDGLVRIALHSAAPKFVGFRVFDGDDSHRYRPGAGLPTAEALQERLAGFELWLRSVKGPKDEHRGMMPWLQSALRKQLFLTELGLNWVLLHHEWRFPDGTLCDVLAVNLSNGQLGIVEFKPEQSQLAMARKQVAGYGLQWQKHAEELAPYFTTVLNAMGRAYGNERARETVVTAQPAALFVGVASPGKKLRTQSLS